MTQAEPEGARNASADLVVVLAAGEGTRMKSPELPKVLHELAGRPLLGHVVDAAETAGAPRICVVVGHHREAVSEYLGEAYPQVTTAVQAEQNGTGHAVRCALEALAEAGSPVETGTVVVVAGDTPLLTAATLEHLVTEHERAGAKATVLSAELDDPTGYGRIVRDSSGLVRGIVEHKDATDAQRAIREVNSGMYVFDAAALTATIGRLTTDNVQGEEYLTDVLGLLVGDGEVVAAAVAADADDILGINDREQLAVAGAILRDRINSEWMRAGVTIIDPATTWIESTVQLEAGVTICPSSYLQGQTTVAAGAVIGPDSTLIDCEVAAGAEVLRSHLVDAYVGAGASVGPFTYLRPGARLGQGGKAGAFVEIKNSNVGDGAKVPHLSYVGDADIGSGSNIGAATVFVNYDGVSKHRIVVGENARVGSDTMLVAPVEIGDGAYTGAGSVITEDVPPGALALGRATQRNIEDWVLRARPGTSSASSATSAQSALHADPGGAGGRDDEETSNRSQAGDPS